MYGETGAAMRTELAALLEQHRIQHRLGDTLEQRTDAGEVIGQYRHSLLVWCTQAMQVATPMVFSNVRPRVRDPFRATDQMGAARELARAVEYATASSTFGPAPLPLITTPQENPVVEHWRQAARAAVLAEYDTNPTVTGQITSAQAQALVADVAVTTQALVVLDKRYRKLPGWTTLPNPVQLGWSALAAAIDANLKTPDYGIDAEGWRPRVKLLRGPTRPGILGVLQAEHNLLIRLQTFPHVANLRLVADSQRHISRQLTPHAARVDETLAARWEQRANTYELIRQQLRDIGSLLGTGDLAAAETAKIVSRLRTVPTDKVIEPRTLAAFQTLYDKIDQRITDIVEEGLERTVFTQRVTLPRLDTGRGALTAPVRERHRIITNADDLDVVRTVREHLRPPTDTQLTGPGDSRADLHAALARPLASSRRVETPEL